MRRTSAPGSTGPVDAMATPAVPRDEDLAEAIAHLNRLLPLQERQRALAPPLCELHRAVLRSFAAAGVPLTRDQVAAWPGIGDMDAALQRLADDDLVVLSPDRREIAGAYPFTVEPRVHRVTVNGLIVHAMCALDALSVAPLFGVATHIDSRCHLTQRPVAIDMQAACILTAQPVDPWVGIHWQATGGSAAQSLCLEMVFLYDRETARAWQQQDPEQTSLFNLADAVAFGAAFFRPLLA